ncbi:MAG: hypothetical protein ACAI25_02680 [Planctomycetota bacterium]
MKFGQIAGGFVFGVVLALGFSGPMKTYAEDPARASAALTGKKVTLTASAVSAKQDGIVDAVDGVGLTFSYEVGGKQLQLFIPWTSVQGINIHK